MAALVFAFTFLSIGAQDPQDASQNQDGAALERAVNEGRYQDALDILNRFQPEGSPPNSQLDLLRGAFLNRLGRHQEAEAVLEKTLKTDVVPAAAGNLHLELGTAHYWQQNYEPAVAELTKAIELGTPREGEARTMLGAALAATGKYKEAQDEFEKAGQELKPDSPMYSSAQEWRDHLAKALAEPETDRWGARLQLGFGHSSNALRTSNDSPLPGNVSNRSTWFFQAQGTLWGDAYRDEETRLRFSVMPEVRRYFDASAFSYYTLPAQGLLTHNVDEDLTLGIGLNWENTWLMDPGRHFKQTIEPLALGEYRWSDMTMTRLTISHPFTNYYLAGLAGPLNPDSEAWRLRLEQIIFLTEEKDLALIPSVGYTASDADGSDWDYHAPDVSVAVLWRPTDELSITAGVYAAWYAYENPNSLSATGAVRRDTTVVPFASATYRVNDWFGITASFSHTDNSSNVGIFDYNNTEWSVMPYVDVGNLIGRAFED